MNLNNFIIILVLTIIITIFLINKIDKPIKKNNAIKLAIIIILLANIISIILSESNNLNILTNVLSSSISGYFCYNLLRKKLNIKILCKSFITLLIFLSSSIFQIIPIRMFGITASSVTITLNVYLTLFSDIFVLTILLLMYYDDLKKGIINAKKNFNEFFDISCKWWVLGFVGMVISNLLINLIFPNAVASNENSVQQMISSSPFIMLLCAGVIAPIIEELTFRQAFKDVLKNRWLFILVSGFVFGGMHVIFSFDNLIDLIYIIPYSILGISFSYMNTKTDNIISSIMMHFIHNTLIISFSVLTGMILL